MQYLDFKAFNLICVKLAGVCWREVVKETQFALKVFLLIIFLLLIKTILLFFFNDLVNF